MVPQPSQPQLQVPPRPSTSTNPTNTPPPVTPPPTPLPTTTSPTTTTTTPQAPTPATTPPVTSTPTSTPTLAPLTPAPAPVDTSSSSTSTTTSQPPATPSTQAPNPAIPEPTPVTAGPAPEPSPVSASSTPASTPSTPAPNTPATSPNTPEPSPSTPAPSPSTPAPTTEPTPTSSSSTSNDVISTSTALVTPEGSSSRLEEITSSEIFIIGVSCGGVLLLVILIVSIVLCVWRNKSSKKREKTRKALEAYGNLPATSIPARASQGQQYKDIIYTNSHRSQTSDLGSAGASYSNVLSDGTSTFDSNSDGTKNSQRIQDLPHDPTYANSQMLTTPSASRNEMVTTPSASRNEMDAIYYDRSNDVGAAGPFLNEFTNPSYLSASPMNSPKVSAKSTDSAPPVEVVYSQVKRKNKASVNENSGGDHQQLTAAPASDGNTAGRNSSSFFFGI